MDSSKDAIEQVATDLTDLARTLQAQDDTSDVLDEIVSAAIALIPGLQEASLSVVTGRARVEAKHPSSKLPERVDLVQTEVGEGPCLSAIYEQATVRVPDLRDEQRWPEFAAVPSTWGSAACCPSSSTWRATTSARSTSTAGSRAPSTTSPSRSGSSSPATPPSPSPTRSRSPSSPGRSTRGT